MEPALPNRAAANQADLRLSNSLRVTPCSSVVAMSMNARLSSRAAARPPAIVSYRSDDGIDHWGASEPGGVSNNRDVVEGMSDLHMSGP